MVKVDPCFPLGKGRHFKENSYGLPFLIYRAGKNLPAGQDRQSDGITISLMRFLGNNYFFTGSEYVTFLSRGRYTCPTEGRARSRPRNKKVTIHEPVKTIFTVIGPPHNIQQSFQVFHLHTKKSPKNRKTLITQKPQEIGISK